MREERIGRYTAERNEMKNHLKQTRHVLERDQKLHLKDEGEEGRKCKSELHIPKKQ